jgi:hypothetical protein
LAEGLRTPDGSHSLGSRHLARRYVTVKQPTQEPVRLWRRVFPRGYTFDSLLGWCAIALDSLRT